MNVLKREEYSRSLPNSKWLRNMLENHNEDLKDDKEFEYEVTMSEKILEQSVRVVEGKPIYLTEEQWDWLYDEILYMRRDLFFGLEYLCNQGVAEEERDAAFDDWCESLDYYTTLFEKDIDSLLETLPFETFRCVGCNKELEKKHMRISIWSRNDQSDESSQLICSQKIHCRSILEKEIHHLKTDKPDDGWFSYAFGNCDDDGEPKNPLPWDREKILTLLRNA